jgi:hypothetical protein
MTPETRMMTPTPTTLQHHVFGELQLQTLLMRASTWSRHREHEDSEAEVVALMPTA